MGLPPEALTFLKENMAFQEKCPHCKGLILRRLEGIGAFGGPDENEHPLYRYPLKDERCADEFVQAVSWDDGYRYFLGLRVGSLVFKWLESTIDDFFSLNQGD